MGLSHFDLALVALYLIGITIFGLRFRSGERSLKSYFLADNRIPWWAIALSIVAAETSTLTIISVPGLAYDKDFSFLQLVIGYLIGRVVICFLLLPQYFKGQLFTAYQLIDRRFGHRLHKFTAGVFLVTRAAAEGVRVYAVSLVVSIALGFSPTLRSDIIAIGIITLLTLIYTFEGGLTAVIWTDVVQMAIYMVGTAIGLATILHLIPGGWATLHATAAAAGKFHVISLSLNPAQTLHAICRDHRWSVPHHRQPRHRSTDGATSARREGPARGAHRAPIERRLRLHPVLVLSAGRRGAFCDVQRREVRYVARPSLSRRSSSNACPTGYPDC